LQPLAILLLGGFSAFFANLLASGPPLLKSTNYRCIHLVRTKSALFSMDILSLSRFAFRSFAKKKLHFTKEQIFAWSEK
jgi:hypothetical protein